MNNEQTKTNNSKRIAKKAILICIVAILIIALVFGSLIILGLNGFVDMSWLFGKVEPAVSTDYDINYDDLAVKPNLENLSNVTVVDASNLSFSEDMTDSEEVLKSVSYLYNLANQNLIDMNYYACVAYGLSDVTMGDSIIGNSESREYIVKDEDEWFFQNYIKANVSGMVGNTIKNLVESSEERYTNNHGETIYKRHGGSDSLSSTCIADFLSTEKQPIIYSEMAQPGASKHAPKIYTSAEYNDFRNVRISYDEIDNALIYAGEKNGSFYTTLEQASLTYDSSKDLYTIVFDVNISGDSEALEKGRNNLSKANGSSVWYEKQHQTITIWGSGLFCSYHTENRWATKIYGSNNNYQKFFTYNKNNVKKIVIPTDTSWISTCSYGVAD